MYHSKHRPSGRWSPRTPETILQGKLESPPYPPQRGQKTQSKYGQQKQCSASSFFTLKLPVIHLPFRVNVLLQLFRLSIVLSDQKDTSQLHSETSFIESFRVFRWFITKAPDRIVSITISLAASISTFVTSFSCHLICLDVFLIGNCTP